MRRTSSMVLALACVTGAGSVVYAQPPSADLPPEYAAVLSTLSRGGDFKQGVLKVNLPRTDLAVTIKDRKVPTALGFGGWVALTKGDAGHEVLMGDLVLTEAEVNPVMSALLDHGFDVTALHNHFFWEQPRIFYMHVHGMGTAADLATRLKPALERMGKPAAAPATPSAPAPATLDDAALSAAVGAPGERSGAVYKITVCRSDFTMKEHGAVINARMGLNTWAAFTGTDADAMVAGDVAMLEREVTPVLKALRANGIDVVSIHQHMTGESPRVMFLHYFGVGPAATLAKGVRAALDVLGKVS